MVGLGDEAENIYLTALYYSFSDMHLGTTQFPDSEMFREDAAFFISKNELAAEGFYFLYRNDCVRCNLGVGSPATFHAFAIDVGPRVVVSCAAILRTMFLSSLTTSRV
jgi:hypothetical protein